MHPVSVEQTDGRTPDDRLAARDAVRHAGVEMVGRQILVCLDNTEVGDVWDIPHRVEASL